MEAITSFSQLPGVLKGGERAGVAVVAPHDLNTILAAKEAVETELADIRFFGNKAETLALMQEAGLSSSDVVLHEADGDEAAVDAAIASVQAGESQAIMKGALSTATVLRGVLSKKNGLVETGVCSFVSVCEVPGRDRLLMVTDGGLNIAPDLAAKVAIANNAIALAHALGIARPKVAVLAAVEKVSPRMQATLDAQRMAEMGREGVFGDADVDGPLSLDLAVSERAATAKGVGGPVAGNADILVVHCIEVGNALAKGLTYFSGSSNATLVLGAKVPLIIPSRATKKSGKGVSLALAMMLLRNVPR